MGTPALWAIFNACVLGALAIDLGIFHRRAHQVSISEAAVWSAVWVLLSLAFNLWILETHGQAAALEFFTAYLVEKSLSLDNIFIFALVFRAFGVESRFQHRVLHWGLLGALTLRGAMIGIGTALVRRFTWVLYPFGAFLFVSGVRMLWRGQHDFHPERNPVLRWARRVLPVSPKHMHESFFVLENGRRMVTPLFLALLVLEISDLLFAVDSIPAVFGITRDPFIVYTSNVCAILGLRAFYFLLAGALSYFRYFDAGLSAVLIFIGGKMLAEPWLHLSTPVALGVISMIMGIAIGASIVAAKRTSQNDGPIP
jgi:TerC family integral membrane protein